MKSNKVTVGQVYISPFTHKVTIAQVDHTFDGIEVEIVIQDPCPTALQYGWHLNQGFDDVPSGWETEDGEEKFNAAFDEWQERYLAAKIENGE